MNKKYLFILLALFIPKLLFGAMSFDGVNDFVRIQNVNESTTTLSVFCFIKTGDTSINKMFVSLYQLTGINGRAWFMGTSNTAWPGATGAELSVSISSDGKATTGSLKSYWTNRIITDNVWHCVGFTFSPNDLKLYIDGEEAAVTKFTDPTLAGIFQSTVSVAIGALNPESGSSNGINGVIDDVRIYNRVLSGNEIRSLALSRNRNVLINSDGLAGYWPLDNGITGTSTNGGSVIDMSPYQNHGTPLNGPNWAQSTWLSY